MTKLKHSPAPWAVGYGYADYLAIEDSEYDTIALTELDDHGAEPTEEQEANARLMAAAPDLLKACKLLVVTLNVITNLDTHIIRTANAAIEKAEGKDD